MAAIPINSPNVVIASKYSRVLSATLPSLRRFACAAIPVVSVPKISGATATLISRRKMDAKHLEMHRSPACIHSQLPARQHGEERPIGEGTPAENGSEQKRQGDPAQHGA